MVHYTATTHLKKNSSSYIIGFYDVVIVGIGGGGLISGIATAVKGKNPNTKVYGVEPNGACAMSLSLKQSKPVHLKRVDTVAYDLSVPFAGEYTLAHIQ